MGYEIRLRHAARKQLDAIPQSAYERIDHVISGLAQNARPAGVKKLSDSGLWRVRTGNYRVVYAIDDKAGIIVVVRVAPRKEGTYKNLQA